jgi:hypothetical protein
MTYYERLKYAEEAIQATSIQVQGLLQEKTVAAVCFPPQHNLKKEQFEKFFKTLGSKFIAGGDYNSNHIQLGSRLTTTKGRELSKVLQEQNHSFLSTGSPTYWSTDAKNSRIFWNFFITSGISTTYFEIQTSYDLTSDQTPVRLTLSTTVTVRQPPLQLRTTLKNWEAYRNLVSDKVNLAIKLKESEDVERAIDTFISVLQHAAQEATPTRYPQRPTNYIPSEIKRLVVEKRKAKPTWQKTHTPDSRRLFNQASNKLQSAYAFIRPLIHT